MDHMYVNRNQFDENTKGTIILLQILAGRNSQFVVF